MNEKTPLPKVALVVYLAPVNGCALQPIYCYYFFLYIKSARRGGRGERGGRGSILAGQPRLETVRTMLPLEKAALAGFS